LVRNFDVRRRSVTLEIAFEADFADLFEVRGTRRERRGERLPAEVGSSRVVLAYRGLDGHSRSTTLSFDPPPIALGETFARSGLALAPGEARSIFVEVNCRTEGVNHPPRRAFFAALREARRGLRAASSRAASIATSNEIFNESVRRSVSDLCML